MKIKTLLITTLLLLISHTIWSQIKIDSSKIVRVLTFNILHGATTKGDFDLDVIAKVIKDANPDFVALQEVDFMTNRAKKYDLVKELGVRTQRIYLFGKAMSYDDGEYGEGILSKHSFIRNRNIALPYSRGKEPRTALEIVTTLKSKDTIAFISTHLDHTKVTTDRIHQVKKINKVFSANKYPTILAGDFNAEPNSTAINILEKTWGASYDKNHSIPTFPSHKPSKKIDYIFFYPKNRWKVIKTKVIKNSIASDHCAYLVTLQLLKK